MILGVNYFFENDMDMLIGNCGDYVDGCFGLIVDDYVDIDQVVVEMIKIEKFILVVGFLFFQ